MDGGGYFHPRSAPDSWRMPQVGLSIRFGSMLNDHSPWFFFVPGGQHSVSSLASHWLHKPWFGLNLQVWYLEWKPARIGLNPQHIRWTTWVQLSISTGWLKWMPTKSEIDELQPAGWQACRSYWFIEAVRFLSYNHSKSLKFPGLYLGLDGKQQKVKPLC